MADGSGAACTSDAGPMPMASMTAGVFFGKGLSFQEFFSVDILYLNTVMSKIYRSSYVQYLIIYPSSEYFPARDLIRPSKNVQHDR